MGIDPPPLLAKARATIWFRVPFVVVLAVMFGSRLGPHDRLVPAFLLVWGPPVAAYLLALRTRAGSVLTGLGLIGLLWVLLERYSVALDSGSSTAGLVMVMFTFYGLVVVAGAFGLEWAIVSWPSDEEPDETSM